MKHAIITYLTASIWFVCTAGANTGDLEMEWAYTLTGSIGNEPTCLPIPLGIDFAIDTNQCIYILASFRNIVDVDPSCNVYNLTTEARGMFIAKYDSSGNLIWARAVSGWYEEGSSYGYIQNSNIELDNIGNVYVTGTFQGTLDFDVSEGTLILTSEMPGMFITKYDSSGNLIWARAVSGWYEEGSSYCCIQNSTIKLDNIGNVYVTGIFQGTLDFDPSEGTFNLTSERKGMFVSKYDSSGNFVWAHAVSGWEELFSWGSSRSHEIQNSDITLDNIGNVFVTGTFQGTLDFDTSESTLNLTSELQGMFISKYDMSGNFVWTHAVSGWMEKVSSSGFRSHEIQNSIITHDKIGNVYATGIFRGTLDFDLKEGTFNLSSEQQGMFITKYDSSGNLIWACAINGCGAPISPYNFNSDITLDDIGNIYLTGTFQGMVDFDPSEGTLNLTSEGQGMFITKYDLWGNFVWAHAVSGWIEQFPPNGFRRHEILGCKIAHDSMKNIYIAGKCSGMLDFDVSEERFDLTGNMFAVKYTIPNNHPMGNAGQDVNVFAWIDGIAEINLDGSASYDDDGDELTYLWRWSIDGNDYEANGLSPTIELPVGQHMIELVVNDGWEDSEPNQVEITVVEPIEATLWITPQIIHRRCEQRRIMTILRLPEGITKDQIDNNSAMLFYPGEVESLSQFINDARRVCVFAFFDRDEILEAIGENGLMLVYVVGQLKTGQYFYGSDTIRIINPGRPYKPKPWPKVWSFGRYYIH